MKLNCLHCGNHENAKFAATKKGSICLVCFEKSVEMTPENQKEVAELELSKYLARQTGGNNRKFTRGYMAMRNKVKFLENLPDKSEAQTHFLNGFAEALKTFETEAVLKF